MQFCSLSCVVAQTLWWSIPAWLVWLVAAFVAVYACSAQFRRRVRLAWAVVVQGGSLLILLVRFKLGWVKVPPSLAPPPVLMKRPPAPPLRRRVVQKELEAKKPEVKEPEVHVSKLLETIPIETVFFSAHEAEAAVQS